MRKWISKKVAGLLCLCLTGALLAGCAGTEKSNSETVLFEYAGQKVYLDEAWIYAKTIQSQYESWYGTSIWDYEVSDEDGNPATMEEVTKKDMITQIKMVKYLSSEAKKNNISLTDEEKEEAKTNAETSMSSISESDLQQTGITLETMTKVYEENQLASKYHDQIVEEADLTVTDEEARQYKTYNLLFETFEYDDSGQKVEYSAKKKASQKKKAEEALKRIRAGEDDLEKLAEEYKATNSSEYTMGDDESTVEEYREAALKLKKNEVSDIVESEFGYHIIKMLDTNDEEATEEKKEELLSEKQSEYFTEKYTELTEDLEAKWDFDKDVNQKAYKKITFKQEETEASTTSSDTTSSDTTSTDTTSSETDTSSESTTGTSESNTAE